MHHYASRLNTAVIGLQFGDEGKGQVVDRLTGNHDVVVRHPQLGERRRTVAVGASGPTRVGIDMRP